MKKRSESDKDLLEKLSGTPAFWKTFWEGLPTGILIIDKDHRIQGANPAMLELLDRPEEEVLGEKCHEVIFDSGKPCENESLTCPCTPVFSGSTVSASGEFCRPNRKGSFQHLQIRSCPIMDEKGNVEYAMEFILDVTAEKLLNDFQEEAALRDPLTGLYNRKAFHLFLDREIKRIQRQGHTISLCMLDLDSFKDFNEKQGEEEGDRLLEVLGGLLIDSTRKEVDSVFRLEADRFALILPEACYDTTVKIVERIRSAQKKTRFPVAFSIAICEAVEGEEAETFYHRAEEALFRAKKKGGNHNL